MNNLFIIVGGAGVGKSDLIKYVSGMGKENNFYYIKKYTTRKARPEELKSDYKVDFFFSDIKEYKKIEKDMSYFKFEYGGEKYWFELDYLSKLIKDKSVKKNIFLNFSNFEYAKQIKQMFLFEANVVLVFVFADKYSLDSRMKKLDYTQEQIGFRLNRSDNIWKQYIENNYNKVVDHVILNSGSINDFYSLIEGLVEKYN